MVKKQKVKFHKGDKRPGTHQFTLSYTKKMIKKRKNIYWQVIEKPTGSIIKECFFEEDAQHLADFQNKNQVWKLSGGIPKMFWIRA